MTMLIDAHLAPHPAAVAAARGALDGLRRALPPGRLDDLRLMTSELVTNSLRHAGLQPDQPIELRVDLQPDRVRVEVLDHGRGFLPRERAADQDAGSGWGLFLVERLADRWGVNGSGATRVWLELARAGRG
jgi:anti-sigma regulatory factor (Ser/Thr protein kinase)